MTYGRRGVRIWLTLLLTLAVAFGQDSQYPFSPVRPAPSREELKFVQALNDFDVKDVAGQRWRLDRLKDRVTIVYVWQPRCLPCLETIAHIQRLFQASEAAAPTREKKASVQVLTIGTNEVRDFLKRNRYTFPVIMSFELEPGLFPSLVEPEMYIVDRSGRRTDSLRFWSVGRVVIEAEKLAASSAAQQ